MTTVTQRCAQVLAVLLQCLMFALVFSVSWQVFSRYLFSSPSSWTEEAARFLLIWISILGAAYVYYRKQHIGLDLLQQSLPQYRQPALQLIIHSMCALFAFLVMVVGGAKLVLLTLVLHQVSPALGLPIGYVYSVIPLSGALIIWFAIYHVVRGPSEQEII